MILSSILATLPTTTNKEKIKTRVDFSTKQTISVAI